MNAGDTVFLPDPTLGRSNVESEHIRLQMAASTVAERRFTSSSSNEACVSNFTLPT